MVGIDQLGRNAAEVMCTIRDLGQRQIVLRSLREGIDTANATGRMIAGVRSVARRAGARAPAGTPGSLEVGPKGRGLPIGRPKALTDRQVRQAEQLRATGEPVPEIAKTLGVSRATLYRVLAERV